MGVSEPRQNGRTRRQQLLVLWSLPHHESCGHLLKLFPCELMFLTDAKLAAPGFHRWISFVASFLRVSLISPFAVISYPSTHHTGAADILLCSLF